MFQEGFSVHQGVFSDEECDALILKIDTISEGQSKAGIRHLMQDPAFSRIAKDIRLREILKANGHSSFLPYKATLFSKTGKANWLVSWHQDIALPIESAVSHPDWGPFAQKQGVLFGIAPTTTLRNIVALRIHLDASTHENGPLRVIPGSHHDRVVDDEDFRKIVDTGPHIELNVGRGGVIAMSPLLFHASSKCTTSKPRRVIHIEYTKNIEIAEGVRLAIS